MSKCPTKNMMKNIIDFNVVPIMHEEEIGNFDEFDKNIQVTMKGGHRFIQLLIVVKERCVNL